MMMPSSYTLQDAGRSLTELTTDDLIQALAGFRLPLAWRETAGKPFDELKQHMPESQAAWVLLAWRLVHLTTGMFPDPQWPAVLRKKGLDLQALARVVVPFYAAVSTEILRAFVIDDAGYIERTMLWPGQPGHVTMSPAEFLSLTEGKAGRRVILVHNHPWREVHEFAPHPSRQDQQSTRQLHRTFRDRGLTLYDHVIVVPLPDRSEDDAVHYVHPYRVRGRITQRWGLVSLRALGVFDPANAEAV